MSETHLAKKINYVIWQSPFSVCNLLRWGQYLVPLDGTSDELKGGEEDYRTWLAEKLITLQAKVYKLNALNNLVEGIAVLKPYQCLNSFRTRKKEDVTLFGIAVGRLELWR
jgi:hypothetical protein